MSAAKKNQTVGTSKPKKVPPLRIEDCRIVWRNFSGAQKRFNPPGMRNFHVVIDPETAILLKRDGWNIKEHPAREEGEPMWYSLKVAVRFDNYPPTIIIKNGAIRTTLDEGSLDVLDWGELSNVKLMINGSAYSTPTSSGIKAYLSRMMATISESDMSFAGIEPMPTTKDEH